eukprot:gene2737-2914_t
MSDDEDFSPHNNHRAPLPGTAHAPHYQPMMISQPEMEIATQHDFSASQGLLLNSEEEKLLVDNPNLKPILPWAKLISKCNNMPNYELMDQLPDEEERYNVYTLGRSSQCAIKFDTPRISNRHCIIYCKMNKSNPNPKEHYLEAFIEDCSANGTFINKKIKLKKGVPRQLHSSDEISLLNPALITQNVGVSEIDILNNTYQIMINLPNQNKTSNLIHANKSLKAQVLTKAVEESSALLGRSNTVIRLLKQQRNIYDFYEFRELLGTGTSGEVFHGIKKDTGKDWAIKVINLKKMLNTSAGNNQQLMNEMIANTAAITKEAEMLRSLRHPNIVHLEDIFSDDENIFLIMELSFGGDLFDRISSKKRYHENEAKLVMYQLIDAMVYLHNMNIMHRDLKPENILLIDKLNDCNIKISDFGLAKILENDNNHGEHLNRHQTKGGKVTGAKTFCGTPQYFAPEVLQRQKTILGQGSYSVEADMWSVGVIMYVLIAGAFPFSDRALYQPQLYSKYNIRTGVWVTISEQAKDLLSHLLVMDPKHRLTAKQARDHPWFDDIRPQKVSETGNTASNTSSESAMEIPTELITPKGEDDPRFHSPVKAEPNLMAPPPAPVPAVNHSSPKRTRSSNRVQKTDSSVMLVETPAGAGEESRGADSIEEEEGDDGAKNQSNTRGRRKRSIAEVAQAPVRASPRRKGNQGEWIGAVSKRSKVILGG